MGKEEVGLSLGRGKQVKALRLEDLVFKEWKGQPTDIWWICCGKPEWHITELQGLKMAR